MASFYPRKPVALTAAMLEGKKKELVVLESAGGAVITNNGQPSCGLPGPLSQQRIGITASRKH